MQRGKKKKPDDAAELDTVAKRIRTLSTPVSGLLEDQQEPNCEQWNVEDVAFFLKKSGFDDYASIFKGNFHLTKVNLGKFRTLINKITQAVPFFRK